MFLYCSFAALGFLIVPRFPSELIDSLVELSGIEPLTSSLRKRYTTYFQQLSATKSSCFERKGTDNNPYCSFIVPGLFPRWHAN